MLKTAKKPLDLFLIGEVHVLVMDDCFENRYTVPWVREFERLLDRVEQEATSKALITVSGIPGVFHKGFDFELWKRDQVQ
jgi:hypothetical protein